MKNNKVLESIKWFFKSYIWIIPLTIILDQVTKLVVQAKKITMLPIIKGFFYIDLQYNTGAAWGIFGGDTENKIFLGIFSLIAGLIMVAYLLWRYKKITLFNRIALLLMIGGCFGNMIDRLFYSKGVIDFLSFHFGSYQFSTFNLADSFLVIGVFILIILMIFEGNTSKKEIETESIEEVSEESATKDNEE